MPSTIFSMLCFCIMAANVTSDVSKSGNRLLRRSKRYIAFPEGASVSLALCTSITLFTSAPSIFTEGLNWAINYDLPNSTSVSTELFNSKTGRQRRMRRDLYEKIEIVLDSMGYNGRICLLRALCEIENKIYKEDKNIIDELMGIIFRFPLQQVHNSEPEIHRFYREAREMGREKRNCGRLFPSCQFSLLDVI